MRSIGRELLSVLIVLVMPFALVLSFPFDAIGFVASPHRVRKPAFASFVTLTDAEHSAAMRAAKTSWQGDSRGVRRMRVNLSVGVLPEDASMGSLDVGLCPRRGFLAPLDFTPGTDPVSVAAPPVHRLQTAPETRVRLPFSKSELLKINQ